MWTERNKGLSPVTCDTSPQLDHVSTWVLPHYHHTTNLDIAPDGDERARDALRIFCFYSVSFFFLYFNFFGLLNLYLQLDYYVCSQIADWKSTTTIAITTLSPSQMRWAWHPQHTMMSVPTPTAAGSEGEGRERGSRCWCVSNHYVFFLYYFFLY